MRVKPKSMKVGGKSLLKITTEKTTGEMAKNVEHMYYNKL